MSVPSTPQLERHIRASASDSGNVALTAHALQRMRQRRINLPMVMETLTRGKVRGQPEPDLRHPGLKCRMQRFVAGIEVAAVVYVEYPAPALVVVTVIDVSEV